MAMGGTLTTKVGGGGGFGIKNWVYGTAVRQ